MATDIKFESATLERVILAYLIKDKSFFLKIAQYLKTSDYNKKTYFIDGKLQLRKLHKLDNLILYWQKLLEPL